MHLVEIAQAPCLVCGKGNTPTNSGRPNRFVDLERDVNWNDPALLCEDCGSRVGMLLGMLGEEEQLSLNKTIEKRDREIHDLTAELDTAKKRVRNAVRRAQAAETLRA